MFLTTEAKLLEVQYTPFEQREAWHVIRKLYKTPIRKTIDVTLL